MRECVSISAVEAAARNNNRPGPDHMNCGESVIAALWDAFEPDFPRAVVAAGAGMGAGVGGSGCICGALAGGVAFLGLMLETKERAKPAAAELHDAFCAGVGKRTPCCRVLTRGMEWTSPERIAHCQSNCALAAAEAARILCRELNVQLEA